MSEKRACTPAQLVWITARDCRAAVSLSEARACSPWAASFSAVDSPTRARVTAADSRRPMPASRSSARARASSSLVATRRPRYRSRAWPCWARTVRVACAAARATRSQAASVRPSFALHHGAWASAAVATSASAISLSMYFAFCGAEGRTTLTAFHAMRRVVSTIGGGPGAAGRQRQGGDQGEKQRPAARARRRPFREQVLRRQHLILVLAACMSATTMSI